MSFSDRKYNYYRKDYTGHSSDPQHLDNFIPYQGYLNNDYSDPSLEYPNKPKIYINPNSLLSSGSVHINKSKFNINGTSSKNSREKLTENKIHYNPKFFLSSSSNQANKIHINPSFAQNLNVDLSKSSNIFVNCEDVPLCTLSKPNFSGYEEKCININSLSNVNDNLVTIKPNVVPQCENNDLVTKVENNNRYHNLNEKLPVINQKFSKISKYKISRVTSNENSNCPHSLATKLSPVIPTRKPRLSGSFKKIGKRKLVRKSLIQHYIASRSKSLPSMMLLSRNCNTFKKLKSVSKYKLIRKNSINRSIDKSQQRKHVPSKFKWNKSVNISRNEFVKLGKRKIVRKSLLQSILEARRTRVCNPVKYTPNKKISSTKLKIKNSVKPVRSRFRVRNVGGQSSQQVSDSSMAGKSNLSCSYSRKKDAGTSTSMFSKSIFFRMPPTLRVKIRYEEKKRRLMLLKKVNNRKKCLYFNRFGYCKRLEEGTCKKVHDAKNIAICRKFLKGICSGDGCKLSHNVVAEKMPICHQFLAGVCVRATCPFLHVKLSHDRPICLDFLQGFCQHGDNCTKRHQFICPVWAEKGSCSVEKCSYPHPQSTNNRTDVSDINPQIKPVVKHQSVECIKTSEIKTQDITKLSDESRSRYFTEIKSNLLDITENENNDESKLDLKDNTNSVYENESLLCFIPFSFHEQA